MIKIISPPHYDTDILIVGAGPAGASLGVHLRRLGYSVTLIDTEKFPRDKVCGDFVGPVALKELEGLGIGDQFESANKIDCSAVFLDGKQLIEQGFPAVPGLPAFGKVIPRVELDEKIFTAARKAGVRTIEQCRFRHYSVYPTHVFAECKLDNNTHYICAKIIVGADGSNSTVARIMNGKKHPDESRILAVRAYYTNTTGPANRADLYFTENSFPGYYWLFPTGPHTANVGVGMVMETMPPGEKHLKEMLEELIASDTSLLSRMADAEIIGKIGGWPLSTYDPDLEYVADRVMLIGDAGGLINALNGEGIQYALLSGRWASETIHIAMQADDPGKQSLSDFRDRVNEAIGYDLALSRTIIQFIRNRKLNPLWLHLLKVIMQRASIDQTYADIAGGILAGVVPASKVIHPAFIAKTALQAGIHFSLLGLHTLMGGPESWQSFTSDAIRSGLHLSEDLVQNTADYLKWTGKLGKDMSRLAQYTIADMASLLKSGKTELRNHE
jgi:menaquinone-9 beta-reductase